jgi:hypothetical protein
VLTLPLFHAYSPYDFPSNASLEGFVCKKRSIRRLGRGRVLDQDETLVHLFVVVIRESRHVFFLPTVLVLFLPRLP